MGPFGANLGPPAVSLLTIPEYDFSTESDVEQKFIMPLLMHPSFLEIPSKAVPTKKSLRALSFVDNSALPKGYIPDYIVFFSGYPVLVIEAKSPEVSVQQAIAEARMYGQLLNQNFPTNINPVAYVMGCNGQQIAVGPTDSNNSKLYSVTEVVIGSDALNQLKELIGVKELSRLAERTKSNIAAKHYITPASRLSSQLFLDRVKQNALAPYLTPLYEMFFRAEDPEKIRLILDQAYVDTAELREYDLVLHSMLRQIERSSEYRHYPDGPPPRVHADARDRPIRGRREHRRTAAPHHRCPRRRQVPVHLPLLHAPDARGAQEPRCVVHHRLQSSALID